MDTQIAVAWLGAAVSVIAGAFTTVKAITAWIVERREARLQARMRLRQEALFEALEVIDHVFANSSLLPGGKKPAPHIWDIAKAWRATNRMILYCKAPKRAVAAFYDAIGIHNPAVQQAGKYGPAQLAEFRKVVAEELDLPPVTFDDNHRVWIAVLPGGVAMASAALPPGSPSA